jgi:hypothetical protein
MPYNDNKCMIDASILAALISAVNCTDFRSNSHTIGILSPDFKVIKATRGKLFAILEWITDDLDEETAEQLSGIIPKLPSAYREAEEYCSSNGKSKPSILDSTLPEEEQIL